MIQQAVITDFLPGKPFCVNEILEQKWKPSGVSDEIELDQELEKVKFNNAIDHNNNIIGVTACFEVIKLDTGLIKVMAKNARTRCMLI